MADYIYWVQMDIPAENEEEFNRVYDTQHVPNTSIIPASPICQRGAKEAGIEDDVIAAIHEYRAPAGLDAKDAAVVQFVLEILRQHRVSDASFEALRSQIGDAGIIDVLVVVSYYHGLAHCLQALGVELPEGVASALTY